MFVIKQANKNEIRNKDTKTYLSNRTQWQESELSRQTFCVQENLRKVTFAGWIKTDALNRIQEQNIQKPDELLPHKWKLNHLYYQPNFKSP